MQPTVPDLAHADWQIQLLSTLLAALTGALTLVIPVLARAVLRYVERRLQIETTAADEERLIRAAQQAVDFVDEQARKRMKLGETPLTAQDKLDLAAGHVQMVLSRHGVGALTRDEVERVVEAVLARRRAPEK